MDNVVLGEECIVGALSLVRAGEVYERRSLLAGNPAKKIKEVSDEMISWKNSGTKLYQELPKQMYENWKPCEPLREITNMPEIKPGDYKPWNETR
jgi:carbonic anhydrase/acetyltransferase-like protein (isoleucine patch superfamily)